MEQKGIFQLLIKMLKTTDKLSKTLGGWVDKSLPGRGCHRGLKRLGRC